MGFVFSDNILHLNAEAFFFSFFKHIFWGVLLKICSCMCTKGLVFYTPPSFVPSGYLNKNKEKKEKKKKKKLRRRRRYVHVQEKRCVLRLQFPHFTDDVTHP